MNAQEAAKACMARLAIPAIHRQFGKDKRPRSPSLWQKIKGILR